VHHTKYFRKTIEKRRGIRQCSENRMSSFYDEHNFIIETPDNLVRIHVYSMHYVQSAIVTTAVDVINIRHALGLDRLFSGSSNSLLKGLQSRRRPFGPQFNMVWAPCCSFVWHVLPNINCTFFISRQLVLLSNLPQLLRSVRGHKRVCWVPNRFTVIFLLFVFV